jgi:4-hydroxybenzoate polyprenyltransferase
MPSEGNAAVLGGVVSRREARLLFWLVLIVLVGVALALFTEVFAVLATPAIILFVAWLLSYVRPWLCSSW